MKTGKEHIVPLSRQMLEILKFAKHYAIGGNYIFFSNRHKNSPMSDVTFSKALWRMGYGNDTIVPQRKKMMQWWADWLDEQKSNREIELNNLDKGYQI